MNAQVSTVRADPLLVATSLNVLDLILPRLQAVERAWARERVGKGRDEYDVWLSLVEAVMKVRGVRGELALMVQEIEGGTYG